MMNDRDASLKQQIAIRYSYYFFGQMFLVPIC